MSIGATDHDGIINMHIKALISTNWWLGAQVLSRSLPPQPREMATSSQTTIPELALIVIIAKNLEASSDGCYKVVLCEYKHTHVYRA
jgi:hypothetical protein